MARIRSIHPGLTTDEAYMSMSMACKAAWTPLWMQCDDHGTFEWKPIVLKAIIFPADNVDFKAILDELMSLDCLKQIEVDGKRYGIVRNFAKYQRPKNPAYKTFKDTQFPDEYAIYIALKKPDQAAVGEQNHYAPPALPQRSPSAPEIPPQRKEEGGRRKDVEEEVSAPADAARTKSVEKKSRKGNATPLPDPYPIQPQISEYAQQRGFTSSELVREHERFCNHAKQNDRRCVDWIAAERNWLITAAERAGKPMQAGQAADDGLIEVVDDDALTAWDNYRRAKEGRTFPRNARGGWRFPSKYPPGYEPRKGEASPPVIPQLPRMSARP